MTAPAEGRRYLPALTGIRALAALLVLALHTSQNVPTRIIAALPFVERGYLGVDLFFVLSGFIITHVYLRSLARPARANVMIFLWHRFIRLYPVHIAVLALLVIVVALARARGIALNSPESWRLSDLVWQVTLLHAWGTTDIAGWNAPSWSISAEWFAYLWFPAIAPVLARVRSRTAALLIAGAALSASAVAFSLAHWSIDTWVGAPALVRVTGEFVCGAALCRARDPALGPSFPGWTGDVLGIAGIAAFLVGASFAVPDFTLVAILAVVIFSAAISTGVLVAALSAPAAVWLGEISYSVYMVHFPILIVLRRVYDRVGLPDWGEGTRAIAFVATILIVIAAAAAMFYAVEQPARRRLRNRLGVLAAE